MSYPCNLPDMRNYHGRVLRAELTPVNSVGMYIVRAPSTPITRTGSVDWPLTERIASDIQVHGDE
jgi:hypothetical protein